MTESSFQQISKWFEQLADLSQNEQLTRIQEIAQTQQLSETQITLLKGMLQADQGNQTLPENIKEVTEDWHVEDAQAQMGQTPLLGSYRLLKPIGTGGMGHVYLAERADGSYKKQVAIKVSQFQVKQSMVKRFENERQILAKLNHSHIAQLLDGGAAEDGRPFIVMEYVEGKDIANYCIDKNLGLRARLRLILQVCEAVTYAHQQLVLHRDLKPNNILVNDQNQVKLLDFGIGKLLDGDNKHLTQTATQIMTRSYASPEQIKGEQVTTASDVFSLAVVAYELLTGYHPYPHQSGLERDQNVVSGQFRKFTKQTGKTKAMYPQLTTIADEKLKGDIENILHKALSPLPENRYSSVEAFADDIKCFLFNRPVMARKQSPWYTFKKLVQRHKALFVITLVTFGVLIGLTHYAIGQAVLAKKIAKTAQFEAEKARATSDFLADLLLKAKPTANAKNLTVQELLNTAYTNVHVDDQLPNDLKYYLIDVIYRSMMSLSQFDQVIKTVGDDYNACVVALGASDDNCQNLLIGQFLIHNNNNQSELAVPLLEKAEQISLKKEPQNHDELLYIYDAKVIVYTDLNQPKVSLSYAEKALELRKKTAKNDPNTIRISMNNLGLSLILDGQFDKAEQVIKDIPEYLAQITVHEKKAMGEEKLYNLWAFFYAQQHNSLKAAANRLKAKQTLKANFDTYSSSMLWTFRVASSELMKAGRLSEAKTSFVETATLMERDPESHAFALQRVYLEMALIAVIEGEWDEASEKLKQSKSVEREIKPKAYTEDIMYWLTTLMAIENQDSNVAVLLRNLPAQLMDNEGVLSELSQMYVSLAKSMAEIKAGKPDNASMHLHNAAQYWQEKPDFYLHLKVLAEALTKKSKNN